MDPLILIRFVHYAATLTAAGTVWFAVLWAAPARGGRLHRRFRILTWTALAVAALSGAAWLGWLAAEIVGAPLADVVRDGDIGAVVTDTRFGQVWAVRMAALALLAALLPYRRTGLLQASLAGLLVALPALTGHAGAAPGATAYGAIAADMVHLVAAGVWLGGLPAFALLLAAGKDAADDAVVRSTRRFATAAAVSVAVLVATGLISSWSLLGGPRDLVTTDYGKVLLTKIALFLAMLVLAALNRFRFTPALPAPAARRALARTTLAESGLGLGLLLMVGALGTLPPGGHVHPASAIPPGAAFVHIHSSEAMADLTIEPGHVGLADATIHLSHEDFSAFDAREVRLALQPPEPDGKTIEISAVRQPDGRWRAAAIALSRDGIWTARVIVTPETGTDFVLDAPVVIAP